MPRLARRRLQFGLISRERAEADSRPPDPLRDDPAALMRSATGFEPDAWQVRLLRSDSPRMLVNCHRQAGKSTATASLAVWTALYRAPALILIVSSGLRASGEMFRKIADVYAGLGAPVRTIEDSSTTLALANGSRVVSLPNNPDTIRSYSAPKLVIADEASRMGDAVFTAVTPMLGVSNGRLLELSTPRGKRGHFYRMWTEGGDDWERITFRGVDNPRLSPEFLASERIGMLKWEFRQEYEGSFEDLEDQLISGDVIEAAFVSPEPAGFFSAEELYA
jgi:hypothetical protein